MKGVRDENSFMVMLVSVIPGGGRADSIWHSQERNTERHHNKIQWQSSACPQGLPISDVGSCVAKH